MINFCYSFTLLSSFPRTEEIKTKSLVSVMYRTVILGRTALSSNYNYIGVINFLRFMCFNMKRGKLSFSFCDINIGN